jgi:ribonuclease T2
MRVAAGIVTALIALTAVLQVSASHAQSKGGEAGKFDYYALVLNWSPSYCAAEGRNRPGEPQCRGDRPYSFILHGLWPQYERGYPLDCRTAERPWVPEELIGKMIDVMPSKRLIIHEYRKHGTCSGLSPQDYFSTSRTLFERIKIPARFQNPDNYVTLPPGEVEKEFLDANPQLQADMISIACKGRNLGDLRICFGRDLQPRSCGVNETQEKLCSSEKIVMPPVRLGAYRTNSDDRNGSDGGNGNEEGDENEEGENEGYED